MNPVRFAGRKTTVNPKGCIVYLVLVPAATFMLWVILIAVLIPLWNLFGVSDKTSGGVDALFLPIILITVIKWAWQDYFGGGYSAVVVSSDRIELEGKRNHGSFPFASLRSVLLKPHLGDSTVVLCPLQGKPRALPPDIAPFSKVRENFESTLLPILVDRLDGRIQSGQPVRLAESRLRALLQLPLAFLMIPLGLACVASLFHMGTGFRLLVAAPRRFRRGWRGLHGGMELRSGGIASTNGAVRTTIPWENLSVEKFDNDGIVLRSRRGGTLSLSPYAEDFWTGARWMTARLSKPPA